MAFTPIPLGLSQGNVFSSGRVLKTYLGGTSTATPMYTDNTGATSTATVLYDSSNMPTVSGSVVFPHISNTVGAVKYVLYPDQASADSDTGALYTWDNIQTSVASESGLATTVEHKLGSDADGSNVFTLSNSYSPGNNSLSVYLNGQKLRLGSGYDYTETSTTTVTLTYNPLDNDTYTFVVGAQQTTASLAASSVTFTSSGTGAVATNVDAVLKDMAITPQMFGAVADGVTDDTAAIQAAADFAASTGAKLYTSSGDYLFSSQLNFFGLKDIEFNGRLLQNFVGVGLLLGYDSNDTEPAYYKIKEAIVSGGGDFSPPANPVIRVQGLKNGILNIGKCHYLQLYADADNNATDLNGVSKSITSVAYSQFHLGFVTKLGLEAQDTTALSWINENCFYGGRIQDLVISGDQNHNHNIFYRPTFEGSTAFPFSITLTTGKSNRIYNARFETSGASSGSITFGSGTLDNTITASYNGSSNAASGFRALSSNISVTENGSGNLIIKDDFIHYTKIELCNISAKDFMVSDGTNYDSAVANTVGLRPGVDFFSVGGFVDCYESELIPVQVGDMFQWSISSDSGDFRSRLIIYDTNKEQITNASDPGYVLFTTATWDNSANLYRTSSSIAGDTDECTIVDSTVAYVQVLVRTGGSGPHLSSNISAYYYAKRDYQGRAVALGKKKPKGMMLPVSPTQGYVQAGTIVADSNTANTTYLCTYNHETTLNGALATSATSVTVTDIDSVANGDIVGVCLDDNSTHWSTVSGLSGSTFTVTALPSAAADNNSIVFARWI